MLDSQIAILENAIIRYAASGKSPGPLGSRHPSISPFAAFKASDDWVIIAVGNDALWEKFCKAVGRKDLVDDPKFATNDKRTENYDQLKTIINEIIADKTVDEVVELLTEYGIPTTPINKVEDIFKDPQIKSRNMLVDVEESVGEDLKVAGNPIKMSGSNDERKREKAPELDENRKEIIDRFLNN
jgi:CoA:oxalate CoA-transferase